MIKVYRYSKLVKIYGQNFFYNSVESSNIDKIRQSHKYLQIILLFKNL